MKKHNITRQTIRFFHLLNRIKIIRNMKTIKDIFISKVNYLEKSKYY